MDSRAGVEKYASGCLTLENWIPRPHGPIERRPGFEYLAAQHAATSKAARLMGFNFANGAYGVFEYAGTSLKVWEDSITTAGPYTTLYSGDILPAVQFAHINNVIYSTHKEKAVHRVIRSGAGSYSLTSDISWTYPPLLDENITTTTLAASATTGSGVTLTASASYFTSQNVGSYFEIAHPRGSSFSEVILGDDAEKASVLLTWSAAPANNDTLTVNGRVYTFKSEGRDAIDELDIGEDADSAFENTLAAINTGGGGAKPHEDIEAEEVGGLKATGYVGNTTGTNFTDNDLVTIGSGDDARNYKMQASTDARNDPYEVLIGASLQASLENLKKAINREAPADADDPDNEYNYSRDANGETTEAHPQVEAVSVSASGSGYKLLVRARKAGAGGNSIVTTDTAANVSWDSATLTGGTRVMKLIARRFGASGNSLTVAESSAALAFAGGATALAGGADETATGSSMVVLGQYEIRTTGRWDGVVYLEKERSIGSGTWDVIRTWKGKNDYNVLETGEFLQRTSVRLKFVGTGEEIDGVFPRAILTPTDPYIRGLVKVTAYTSATQVTVTVVNALAETTATPIWSEGAWSERRGFPRAVCFHQNRLWFAGTTYEPSKLWASALGDFENFRVTSMDDGALAFQIAASEAMEIRWLAVSGALVIGANRGVWIAETTDSQSGFTNTSPPIFRQMSGPGTGCDEQRPVMLQGSICYVTESGREIRGVSYDPGQGFSSSLLTVLNDEVTRTDAGSLAAQTTPDSILWGINGAGELIGLTFEKEQNVFAWHRHPLAQNSKVESVAVVNGPDGDEVWASIWARTASRVICRMDVDTLNKAPGMLLNDYLHLDCAVINSGPSFTSVTVPSYMVGASVVVNYGGGVTETVTPGSTTLTVNSTTFVQVGLAMTSTMQTMRLSIPMRDGNSEGRTIKITSAVLRFRNANGLKVKAGSGSFESVAFPATDRTYTGEAAVSITSSFVNDSTFSVQADGVFPCILSGVALQVDIGEKPAHQFIEEA